MGIFKRDKDSKAAAALPAIKRSRWVRSYPFKLGLTFTLLILAATSTSLFIVYNQTKPILLSQMGNRMLDIGRTATHLFTDADFDAIEKVKTAVAAAQKEHGIVISPAQPGEYRETLSQADAKRIIASDEFQRLVKLLRTIKSATRHQDGVTADTHQMPNEDSNAPTLAFASIFIPVEGDESRQVVEFIADADYDHPTVPAPPGNLLFSNSQALRLGFEGKSAADEDFRFEQGMHVLTAAIPLRDKQGKLTSVLGLYYDAKGEVNYVNLLYVRCIMMIIISAFLAVCSAWLLTWFLTRDMNILREGAERVRDKDFSVSLDIKRHDELGLLANTLNEMIREIKKYAQGLEATNASYSRFVPKQILEFLGQQSITEVRLGDQVQRQMTILFADIRSFTSISESMSPRDNFDFINEYLKTIGPVIRKHNGFIDKYIGDGIMALFPERPEDAVRAAIDVQETLKDFNIQGKDKGRPDVRVGIGIHRGNLMLGTVGEDQRMDGTVISDAVNVGSRLEGLTKQFGATIVMSEAALNAIQGEKKFNYRYLGETTVKGKSRSVRVFEVLDGDEIDSSRRKAITVREFERGVKAFEQGNHTRAAIFFKKVLKINKSDVAAKMYLTESKKFCVKPSTKSSSHLIPVKETGKKYRA